MKKEIIKKINSLISLFFVLLFLLAIHDAYGQVIKDFKPRTSSQATAPYQNVKNYNLQGDFTMIGNTNLTLKDYNDESNNSEDMIYVDIDGDINTVNSSMSELVIPGNECTEIIYAGLYWSGRAHKDESAMSFDISNKEKTYKADKRKVQLKKENDKYFDVWATNENIYYPSKANQNMYVAYADVTEYVRENRGGKYFVANMAIKEGKGGGTGYYGGWGMVVIYKNPSMKWRDITVFDGYGYMNSSKGAAYLSVDGFRAAQSGDVKIKMGMMAGEGDRTIQGDYFHIEKRKSGRFTKLSHGGNSEGNFFNSSIYTGGNNRNPNRKNNTGIDISMFDLDNSGNSLIDNNQNSTRFKYGSTQDLYTIFNIVFAVDAYVPDVVGENASTEYGGAKPLNNGEILPGQEFEFKLDIYNKGTEAVKNTRVEIPVPFNLHYVGADVISGLKAGGNVYWEPPLGGTNDPSITAGGKIIWEIGNLPLDLTKQELLAQLKYRFKVSDNCILLSSNVCGLEVRINGKITGTGVTSSTNVSSDLIRDYGNGVCSGPVYDDFLSTIAVSADFLQNCNPPVEDGIMQFKAFCSVPETGFNRATVEATYPEGSKFFSSIPSSYESRQDLVEGDFPILDSNGKTLYYVMVPGMEAGCYAKLEISIEKVVTEPIVKDLSICFNEQLQLENELSLVGKQKGYSLLYFSTNGDMLSSEPNPKEVGVYNFFVAEGKDGCYGPKKQFTVTILALPNVSKDINDIVLCENFDSQLIQVSTDATNYVWEYSIDGRSNWKELSQNVFPNINLNGSTIEVKHASRDLNGIYIRLNADNGSCSDVSNAFKIMISDCSGITNPMLYNTKSN